MRPYNRARWSISSFLSGGAPLPKMTFLKMRFYSQKNVVFTGETLAKRTRVVALNSIADHWIHGMTDTNAQAGVWQYLDIFRTFYSEYMVLGAKTRIRISKNIHAPFLQPLNPVVNASAPSSVYTPSTEGYWYIRCYYHRADGTPVGRVITHDGNFTENWRTVQQFMQDPTITFFRDSSVGRRVKTGFVLPAAEPANAQIAVPNMGLTGQQFYVEYENYNKSVNFNVTFSYKKHFQDNNPLRNGRWGAFEDSMSEELSFMLYVGYISFSGDNIYFSQTPLDRDANRLMTVDTTLFVGVQGPRITPMSEFLTDANLAAMRANGSVDELESSITRNQDGTTPELEKEVLEEIEHMIESAEEEAIEDARDNESEEE